MGFSPAGRTIEEAHDTIRKEMNRIGIDRLTKHNVKFEVVKTITTEEVVEEVLGSDSSFFMLKG